MRHVLYTQTHKAKHFMDAMLAGFPGDRWPFDCARLVKQRADEKVLHIIGGLQFGALDRMREIRDMGLPYIFYDRAYWGGGPQSDRIRITANAYHKNWIEKRKPGRFEQIGGKLQPWKEGGTHIMVVPPGEAIRKLFRLPSTWEEDMLKRLRKITKRPVWPSYKNDVVPLAERLAKCHCVVTFTSNVAVEAITAGVPAFTSEYAAAAPVAWNLNLLEDALEYPRHGNREAWAESLAWGQFSTNEIRSGFAKEVVMEAFK